MGSETLALGAQWQADWLHEARWCKDAVLAECTSPQRGRPIGGGTAMPLQSGVYCTMPQHTLKRRESGLELPPQSRENGNEVRKVLAKEPHSVGWTLHCGATR